MPASCRKISVPPSKKKLKSWQTVLGLVIVLGIMLEALVLL